MGGFSWCTVGRTFKACVAESPTTTLSDQNLLTFLNQIGHQLIGVPIVGNGADWYRNKFVSAPATGAIGITAIAASFCGVRPDVAKIDQSIDVGITDQINTATVAAIATVGPAAWDIFFPSKTQAAVAAVTGDDFYSGFVDEFHGQRVSVICGCINKKPRRSGVFCFRIPGTVQASSTLTNLRFFGPPV